MTSEDITLELSRLTREAHTNVAIKMASQQLGECFSDLDRRHVAKIARGTDRREAA